MAIPSPLKILSIARTMEKESTSKTDMSKGAGIDKILQVFGLEYLNTLEFWGKKIDSRANK